MPDLALKPILFITALLCLLECVLNNVNRVLRGRQTDCPGLGLQVGVGIPQARSQQCLEHYSEQQEPPTASGCASEKWVPSMASGLISEGQVSREGKPGTVCFPGRVGIQ